VWSCGAILYNMITGIPPFFEADSESLEEKIKTGILSTVYPNYEKNSSEDIKELISGMLTI
jgi:serine/threonine protein kinase